MHLITIMAPGHSGTTIVDRMLSCYPGTLGLGEVAKTAIRILNRHYNAACPCGETLEHCEFWGKLLTANPSTVAETFYRVVETAHKLGYRHIIDSSKRYVGFGVYRDLFERGEITCQTRIRLVRDPRGWVPSEVKRGLVPNALELKRAFYRWVVSHMLLDRRAHSEASPVLYVWYDELMRSPNSNIFTAVFGCSDSEAPKDLEHANQHAPEGNKFVFTDRRRHLYPDTSFMKEGRICSTYDNIMLLKEYYRIVASLHMSVVDQPVFTVPKEGQDLLKVIDKSTEERHLIPVDEFLASILSSYAGSRDSI